MRNPNDLKKRIITNPWFLWILVLLGINPALILDSVPSVAKDFVRDQASYSTYNSR